jgi:hypothetical protein
MRFLLYETVINVLWVILYKLALNTACVGGFFGVNFNGNKKDLCILQRLILIIPEEPLQTL